MPTAYAASAPPRLTPLDAAMGFLGNGGFAGAARISTKERADHQPASVIITKPRRARRSLLEERLRVFVMKSREETVIH
jgi:hypothetical protein